MTDRVTLDQLAPAPYNPRNIAESAERGLRHSLREFGDISGIVWNRQSGYLVAGHQRLNQIRGMFPAETLKLSTVEWDDALGEGWMWLSSGEHQYRVRVVDWNDTKEKAANLAANNRAIGGHFTSDVDELLAELELESPDLVDSLLLDKIVDDSEEMALMLEEAEGKSSGDGPAGMALQPFEHYDYVLVLAKNTQDWEWLVDWLGLEKVDASVVPAKSKKIGLGRGVSAERLIAKIRELQR